MLSGPDQRSALGLAVDAIAYVHRTGRRRLPAVDELPAALRARGAAFVTLRHGADLRGCIGSLAATEPLGIDIARHAMDAAFSDPRFPPVTESELPSLHLEVSVLSAPEPMAVTGWDDLRRQVVPGVDGLVVEAGLHRGTFLPAVWAQLPDPEEFLVHLWHKAGLVPHTWPPGITVSRYRAEEFGGPARSSVTTE